MLGPPKDRILAAPLNSICCTTKTIESYRARWRTCHTANFTPSGATIRKSYIKSHNLSYNKSTANRSKWSSGLTTVRHTASEWSAVLLVGSVEQDRVTPRTSVISLYLQSLSRGHRALSQTVAYLHVPPATPARRQSICFCRSRCYMRAYSNVDSRSASLRNC